MRIGLQPIHFKYETRFVHVFDENTICLYTIYSRMYEARDELSSAPWLLPQYYLQGALQAPGYRCMLFY